MDNLNLGDISTNLPTTILLISYEQAKKEFSYSVERNINTVQKLQNSILTPVIQKRIDAIDKKIKIDLALLMAIENVIEALKDQISKLKNSITDQDNELMKKNEQLLEDITWLREQCDTLEALCMKPKAEKGYEQK